MQVVSLIAFTFATAVGVANGQVTSWVVSLDEDPFQASLSGVENGTIIWRTETGVRRTSLARFVYWGALQSQAPQPEIQLIDGGILTFRRALDIREIDEDHLNVSHTIWQPVRLQRTEVAYVMLDPPVVVREFYSMRDRMRCDQFTPELLLLNGDRLVGTIQSVTKSSVTIRMDSHDLDLERDRIRAFRLAAIAPPDTPDRPRLTVGFRDGSLLRGTVETLNEREMRLRLNSGTMMQSRPDARPLTEIVLLRSIHQRVIYLSSLTPASYKHIPYLSLAWPYRLDRNVVGGPLRVTGIVYDKGIGMHSASRLAFDLPRGSDRFEAELAIDDSSRGRGSVRYRVFLEHDHQWSRIFQSGIVRSGDEPIPCRVELSGAARLALVVDFADRGDQGDHADWLNARVVLHDN